MKKLFSVILLALLLTSALALTFNVQPVEASIYYDPPYDPNIRYMQESLKNLIDEYAEKDEYYDDQWNISPSQYKAWIALISIMEAGNLRFAAHSGEPGVDRFDHWDVGVDFPFCTGIGAFQLDRGGEEGGEDWSGMPTIEKIDPVESLLSTLRWHKERFGEGATLADFAADSVWFAVKDGKRDDEDFRWHWELTTGCDWDDCKDVELEVAFHPPITNKGPFNEVVEYIGEAYWYLENWENYYPTWLISARGYWGSAEYYYAKRSDIGFEMWVWKDPDNKLIYRHARNYGEDKYLPEKNAIGGYGFTDDEPALNPNLMRERSVDVFMLVDLTGSFTDDLPAFKAQAPDLIATLKSSYPDIRFGLGKFEDYPISPFGSASYGDKAYERLIDLTSDADAVLSIIAGLYTRYGVDGPESQLVALYQAATGAGQDLSGVGYPGASIPAGQQANFRDGAIKLFLLWTDAPFHHPGDPGSIPYPGPSFDETVEAILALDPPMVIGISSGGGGLTDLEAIAAATGALAPSGGIDINGDGIIDIPEGEPLVATIGYSGQGIAGAIRSLVEAAVVLPIADAGGPYTGEVGQTVVFDGSGSFDADGWIVLYEWDFESDGVFDFSSAEPTTEYAYPMEFSGLVTLRVTDDDGNVGTDVSPVEVSPPTNLAPVADAGADQIVEQTSPAGAEVTLDGSGSYDPDLGPMPLTYSWSWAGGVASGISPTVLLPPGTTEVTLTVSDGELNDTDTVEVTVVDTIAPEITMLNPPSGWALQDGVTFKARAADAGAGVDYMTFSIREDDGASGWIIGSGEYENMAASYDAVNDWWSLVLDTLELPDGYYVVIVKATDKADPANTGSITVPYSIRNWAVIELLPASQNNKAGRTMPVKFSLRVATSVDPSQPFVYNEELAIKIFATSNPSKILQTSTFGDTARDYRINTWSELYITNFQTLKTPMQYAVDVCRDIFSIGSFTFRTVK